MYPPLADAVAFLKGPLTMRTLLAALAAFLFVLTPALVPTLAGAEEVTETITIPASSEMASFAYVFVESPCLDAVDFVSEVKAPIHGFAQELGVATLLIVARSDGEPMDLSGGLLIFTATYDDSDPLCGELDFAGFTPGDALFIQGASGSEIPGAASIWKLNLSSQ